MKEFYVFPSSPEVVESKFRNDKQNAGQMGFSQTPPITIMLVTIIPTNTMEGPLQESIDEQA